MAPRRRLTAAAAAAAAAGLLRAGGAQEVACPLKVPAGAFPSTVAWTASSNAQPHHVMAPFEADLSPPIGIRGLCEASVLNALRFMAIGVLAGEWNAKPAVPGKVVLQRDGEDCNQQLDGLSVSTATDAALRLHFVGCNRPSSVLAVRVLHDREDEDDPLPVPGIDILDFMCRVSPQECHLAKAAQKSKEGARTSHGSATGPVVEGKVGVGRCDGSGVIPEDMPEAKTESDCANKCNKRVEANLKDPDKQSCRGYAWSELQRACRVYSGWPITSSDGDTQDGFLCYKLRDAWGPASEPAPTTSRPVQQEQRQRLRSPGEGNLALSNLFSDPRAVTARRMQVTPFQDGCFERFDWYILDRSIYVSPDDLAVLKEMTKINRSSFVFSQAGAVKNAPRTELVIERVCVRDCTGELWAECKEPRGGAVAAALLDDADSSVEEVFAANTTDSSCGSFMCQLLGQEALEAATDPDFWPWALLLGLLAGTAGFGVTSCLAVLWRRKSKPRYQTVEAVKLVYEGEDEDEVVLQSTADGAMMSVNGAGPALASWKPSKAGSRNSEMSTSGLRGSRNPDMSMTGFRGSRSPMLSSRGARLA